MLSINSCAFLTSVDPNKALKECLKSSNRGFDSVVPNVRANIGETFTYGRKMTPIPKYLDCEPHKVDGVEVGIYLENLYIPINMFTREEWNHIGQCVENNEVGFVKSGEDGIWVGKKNVTFKFGGETLTAEVQTTRIVFLALLDMIPSDRVEITADGPKLINHNNGEVSIIRYYEDDDRVMELAKKFGLLYGKLLSRCMDISYKWQIKGSGEQVAKFEEEMGPESEY